MEVKVRKLDHCICELTEALDKVLTGYSDMYYVYIPMADITDDRCEYKALRRPGRTIGHVRVNAENTIIEIEIYSHGESSFSEDTYEISKQFIGQHIDNCVS